MRSTIRGVARFSSGEANELHANAFGHRVYAESEWDWVELCRTHGLGWVTARIDGRLVCFVNVISDGLVHAWIQDEMVASGARHHGSELLWFLQHAMQPRRQVASGYTSTSMTT